MSVYSSSAYLPLFRATSGRFRAGSLAGSISAASCNAGRFRTGAAFGGADLLAILFGVGETGRYLVGLALRGDGFLNSLM